MRNDISYIPGYNARHRGGNTSATNNNVRLGRFMIEGLLQPRHLLVILAVALLLFGPKRLPELGKTGRRNLGIQECSQAELAGFCVGFPSIPCNLFQLGVDGQFTKLLLSSDHFATVRP